MNKPLKVHFTGICGVGTGALAVALKKAGWTVTGSDKGFYPPVSTALTEASIPYYAGWHPENIGEVDIAVAGGVGTSPSNPEIKYFREKGIRLVSFAEAVGEFLVKKHSIVVVGTWGKTTSSSLLSFIFDKAGMNPSYFSGGVGIGRDAGALTDSDWSIIEGDEYQVSIKERRAKFFHYKPTDLLMTAMSWDHADLYPTEALYMDAFKKLLANLPRKGKIVYCIDNENLTSLINETIKEGAHDPDAFVSYGKSEKADYRYSNISHTKAGLSFTITYHGKEYVIKSPMLGAYNIENITGCFAMAREQGIAPGVTSDAIAEFPGLKRRLERRFESADGTLTVIDAHAPTPEKAQAGLQSIREVYKGKIVAIFEPNIGGRQRASAHMYDNTFIDATTVFIPRLTKLKIDENAEVQPLEGDELATLMRKTHPSVEYVDNDETLVDSAIRYAQDIGPDNVIVFLGSHGFRGMIEEVVKKLSEIKTS
jgi:UDP-N-acetylmuramate: L-alanyl-gamma-D-glutamyl-meso-diaminopimelate ligase